MVAIVTGKGPGIETGSGSVLGASGLLGSASTGRSGESVLLNAATGNLVISNTDEMLIGRGPDAVVSRTYNSLGAWDGDNNDYWRTGVYRKVADLSGTYGAAATTVKRTDWDGSEITYTWTADYYGTGNGAYVATDGSGAYDTVTKSGSTWTWTDGDTQIAETYDESYSGATFARIVSRRDRDGNAVTYSYSASTGLMTQVTTADGGYTLLTYSGTKLQSLETHAFTPTASITRIFYEYDTYDRLSKVVVNLAPSDNSKTTGSNYETTYTYTDTVNKRVASVAQSDGTLVSFTYDGSNRIATITQTIASGASRVTTVSYGSGFTTITDNAGQATSVWYDANNNLTKIVTPPGADGAPLVKEFAYQSDGDVLWSRESASNTISYVDDPGGTDDYDKYGNRRLVRDAAGNVVRRTYSTDGKNLLLSETRYLTPDPDGAGGTGASSPLTTTYLYDSRNHLRYTVSPEGRVSEYRYDGFGQRVSAIDYTGSAYSSTLSESALNAWVAGTVTRSSAQRTDTWYDFRGNVSRTVTYAALDSFGEGTQDPLGVIAGANTTVDQQSDGLYRVTKTGSTSGAWNADAHSSTKAEGDFVLQVKIGQSNTALAVGVSTSATAGFSTIDYGIFFETNGIAYRLASNSYAALPASGHTTYSAGDTLWMARVGTTLTYYMGATLSAAMSAGALRTITGVSGPLYLTTAIHTAGASADVALTTQDIVNGVNASVAQQPDGLYRLTKTGGSAATWDADARGSVPAAGDFVLRLRPAQNNKYITAGVSTAPGASSSYTNLNYGVIFADNGWTSYDESGTNAALGGYAAGDNFWITRVGTTLRYYTGATLETAIAAGALRTVTGVTGTLYFDSSLYDLSAAVDAAFMLKFLPNESWIEAAGERARPARGQDQSTRRGAGWGSRVAGAGNFRRGRSSCGAAT